MLESFAAFNMNAFYGFLYVVSSNPWFFLLLLGVVGTIVLQLKEEVDTSVREEQNIL